MEHVASRSDWMQVEISEDTVDPTGTSVSNYLSLFSIKQTILY